MGTSNNVGVVSSSDGLTPRDPKWVWLVVVTGLLRDPKSKAELDGWNLMFDDQLVRFGARVLPPEKIYQKDSEVKLVFSETSV